MFSCLESEDSEDDDVNQRTANNSDKSESEDDQLDSASWGDVGITYQPKFDLRQYPEREARIQVKDSLPKHCREIDIFLKLFPMSFVKYISQCTNRRLEILETAKKTKITKTDFGEILVFLGISMVMCYNRLPSIRHYWSNNESMGNHFIKRSMSRNRFQLIGSKLYFAPPEQPPNASKTYYIDDCVSCLKYSFQRCREDSARQSIDEGMVKFKGRSTLKQYMPMKPVKRGIKLWLRCDSVSGYCYDMNVYSGRETGNVEGTLGERVVTELCSTMQKRDVVICFDRFFTSVKLLQDLQFPAVGTYIKNRRNTPNFSGTLKKYESRFVCNGHGITGCQWKDTKDVFMLANCFRDDVSEVDRRQKTGEKVKVSCPEMIAFYNQFMGGVDLCDQYSSLYKHERKSLKWWKKVFYKLFSIAIANSWIIFKNISPRNKDVAFFDFIVPLAEQIIQRGRLTTPNKRKASSKAGRKMKRRLHMTSVGDHLPKVIQTRRRCTKCAEKKNRKKNDNCVYRM